MVSDNDLMQNYLSYIKNQIFSLFPIVKMKPNHVNQNKIFLFKIKRQAKNVFPRDVERTVGSDDKPAPNRGTMSDRQRYVVTSYRRRQTPDVGPTSIWHSMLTVQILNHEII